MLQKAEPQKSWGLARIDLDSYIAHVLKIEISNGDVYNIYIYTKIHWEHIQESAPAKNLQVHFP